MIDATMHWVRRKAPEIGADVVKLVLIGVLVALVIKWIAPG